MLIAAVSLKSSAALKFHGPAWPCSLLLHQEVQSTASINALPICNPSSPSVADFTVKQQRECQAIVKAADVARERFDFVLYGDSVLRVIARGSKAEWARLFPPSKGWHAVPLGVSGNDIEVGSAHACHMGGGSVCLRLPEPWQPRGRAHSEHIRLPCQPFGAAAGRQCAHQ